MKAACFSLFVAALNLASGSPIPDGTGSTTVSVSLTTLEDVWERFHPNISTACYDLLPRHPVTNGSSDLIQPQNSPAPYTVTPSSSEVTPGGTLNVTFSGENFLAIYAQARYAGAEGNYTAVGKFLGVTYGPGKVYPSSCYPEIDNAASFFNSENVTSATLTWEAPDYATSVVFNSTVAVSYGTFWTNVTSPVVTVK